jgi:hypothetical protein
MTEAASNTTGNIVGQEINPVLNEPGSLAVPAERTPNTTSRPCLGNQ